jgi:hypothetical protein
MEILKYNISQCERNDKRIKPEYDIKERKLWRSFSRSPSPNKVVEDNTIEEAEE